MLQTVLDALLELRSPFALYESDIHKSVENCLRAAGLNCEHEACIGKGCRIDYLVGNVGVEIKKGKPDAAALRMQLLRYAACDAVSALVVVSQRTVKVPQTVLGKPVHLIVLSQLWGVALG